MSSSTDKTWTESISDNIQCVLECKLYLRSFLLHSSLKGGLYLQGRLGCSFWKGDIHSLLHLKWTNPGQDLIALWYLQSAKETSKAKEEVNKHQADASAGSTWDNIKDAASSAKDQAANKIDKNTSEFKAKVQRLPRIHHRMSNLHGPGFKLLSLDM